MGRESSKAQFLSWLNGPIFQLVGERSGYRVDIAPFAHRDGFNTVVLTARDRDASSGVGAVGIEMLAVAV